MTHTPQCPTGTTIYFAALESTPAQINTAERLEAFKVFMQSATDEHNRLLAYAAGGIRNPRALELAGKFSELWGELASELAGRYHDLKAVLNEMAVTS